MLATKDTVCTSCGDTIKTGSKITIRNVGTNQTDMLCFRCHPDTGNARIRVPETQAGRNAQIKELGLQPSSALPRRTR